MWNSKLSFLMCCYYLKILVVHNGIITNYKDIKRFLETKGHKFESDTDTEIIAKLVKHIRFLFLLVATTLYFKSSFLLLLIFDTIINI